MSMSTSSIPSIDLHEDVSAYYIYSGGGAPLGDFGEDVPGREADIPKYRKANVRVVFSAIFPGIESFSPEESRALLGLYGRWLPATKYRVPQAILWEHFSIYYKMAEAYGIKIVESLTDLEYCLRGSGLCFVLHLEGAESIDDPYDLVLLRRLGLRSLGITWNYQNKYGSGCGVKKDLGLTSDGEELVKMANKLGIVVDLAHASKRTALEAIATSKKPVIVSHANIRKFVDKPRNVDDEVLEALHKNGGVIGISAIGPLISQKPRPTLSELVDHFTYVRETYGPHLLSIGTDFLGLLGLPAPEGFESIDKLPALYAKLAEKGFSEEDLRKVAYENAIRVLKANFE
ncbi:MAG: membrane dipeptidase [Sulfolobales archaeon]